MVSMNRRQFMQAAGATGAALAVGSAARAATTASPRPNIIVVLVDDMGYSDIGCYGGEIRTPNIDALGTNGVRFTQFYNCAKCTPSRTSLLTGLYHQATGVLSDVPQAVPFTSVQKVLRDSGYRTCMAGKVDHKGDGNWDSRFQALGGAFSFYSPSGTPLADGTPVYVEYGVDVNIDGTQYSPYNPPAGFYTTDAFTDHAIDFIQSTPASQPYFLYVAYNAPHYPLQAPPEDIERYRGTYDIGWDAIREARLARQRQLGVAQDSWVLSSREPGVAAWDSLSSVEKTVQSELMAVYAAMVDRVDQNVGRLMSAVNGRADAANTLVLFLSDNGACHQTFNKTPSAAVGGADSWAAQGLAWANASNTPFRRRKATEHEGGICTPLIAHWPAGITNPGSICRQPGHIVDIMATSVDLAGASYPGTVTPMEGKSLAPALRGETALAHNVLFWQYLGDWRAVRQGRWKALKRNDSTTWWLFDIENDRAEIADVSGQYPAKLAELKTYWDQWKANSYTTEGLSFPRDATRTRGSRAPQLDSRQGLIRQTPSHIDTRCDVPGRHSVELLTLCGSTVTASTRYGRASHRIDRAAYAAGWYLLRLSTASESVTEQVRLGR
jgi:arylsulfatase A-like enzyme